ncbi:hypothetical protein Tco_0035704, partial [Tanacetum coccineum]
LVSCGYLRHYHRGPEFEASKRVNIPSTPRQQLTWLPRMQWPPFDLTVDRRLTGGLAVVDRWSDGGPEEVNGGPPSLTVDRRH